MSGKSDKFFLGKAYNLEKSAMQDELIFYDPDDLTTHAVITGMTGSGKTGLGIIMLEEAALQGIPAIVIDPKGDLTNLLLHFPDLLPEDFRPWVDKDAARREGTSIEEVAEKAASLWKNGLASYDLGEPQLEALREAVDFAVYTPGSDSGLPVSILASFSAPIIPWEGNKEVLRDKISSTVTAILGLIGIKNIDPVRSKEHILLSNIFEEAWRNNQDLDMATLIMQVQSPPFEKLGVFSLDQFYPEKERFKLAMLLNNFLAAPAFQTWLEGQPMEIGSILYSASGKPRHSVFYLAHLSDQERMFFITLLYTTIESWMRTQKGSTSLRALVYFDEIAGYLPPVANPPSKNIILRMLKQARAFGVGLIVATQNPVDLDYKAISNAGTWLIGKLQTDQDKARLLDGLEGAAPGISRQDFDKKISLLDKRVFLLHNVHEDAPEVFHTRWALNYLPGPITRVQIPALNALVDAHIQEVKKAEKQEEIASSKGDQTTLGQTVQPVVPGAISVYFLPADRGPSEALKEVGQTLAGEVPQPTYIYRPVLAGQARVAYINRKYNISHEAVYAIKIEELRRKGLVRWEDYTSQPMALDHFSSSALPDASFESLDALPAEDSKYIKSLQSDFEEWVYRTQVMTIRLNEELGVVAGPDVSDEDFKKMCLEAVEDKTDEEQQAIKEKYQQKYDRLQDRLKDEQEDLEQDKAELSGRRMEELGKGADNILGLFMGRRRSLSTSLTKRRMTSKAKVDVKASERDVQEVLEEMKALEEELQKDLVDAEEHWQRVANEILEEKVSPYKKNIFVEMFGILWQPYYAFMQGERWITVPAFTSEG
ncbi:MAG: helicase HerA domain-containing protein [Anaerolineales bacterium]